MYAITGATGHVGGGIARILLSEGKNVRAIGRSAERLRPLEEKGAESCVGSLEDEAFLTRAFAGAAAVFAMIAPDLRAENLRAYQNRIGAVTARAIEKAGVKHVMHLSSLGAHLPEGTGPVTGLHDQEERLNKLDGVSVLHLRPTFFFENFLNSIPVIKKMGVNGSALRGDVPFPAIATRDIARVAAERLLALDFGGISVRELLGQRDLTMNEVTNILGKAIGKSDLSYVQFSYEDAEHSMVELGISPDVARSYIELNRAINEGTAVSGAPRSKENTTETSIEEFAKVFADAYASS
jgi:uncharacterized protein YbjT (DUF2867 family)